MTYSVNLTNLLRHSPARNKMDNYAISPNVAQSNPNSTSHSSLHTPDPHIP